MEEVNPQRSEKGEGNTTRASVTPIPHPISSPSAGICRTILRSLFALALAAFFVVNIVFRTKRGNYESCTYVIVILLAMQLIDAALALSVFCCCRL